MNWNKNLVANPEKSWFQRLYQELKRRRVIRVVTLYVVLFWPIIQVADILSPALSLPPEAMRYLLVVFVVGFPFVLMLSWLFDLNKSGVVRVTVDESSNPGAPEQALIGRRVERSIIGLLVIVIAVLFYLQNTRPADTVPNAVRAIAVLPFVTFSPNSEDEFFSDGLTEELLNVLSRLQNLRVIARTSSFAYKGVSKNVQEIGRELNVDTILEGSVRRNDVDDTIRVTAQLIEVETGSHVWSRTFNRKFRDIFKIQDEIAAAVVEELKVTLLADEQSRMKSRESASPEAMVVFSMGRAELAKRTRQSLEDAVRFFDKAIGLDPGYADAYAGLANAHALLIDHSPMPDEQLRTAQAAVARALELDKNSADAWAARGLILMQRHERAPAMQALEKAMVLNPSHAMAHMWYGNLQADAEQQQSYHAKAFELDPRSPVAGYNFANDLMLAGREAEAMDVFSSIVEADPYYPQAYELVARINEFRGRLGEAIRSYKRVYELDQRPGVAAELASLYIDIGDFDSADDWMAAAAAGVAAAGGRGSYHTRLEWLRVSALTARGERAAAEQIIRSMLDVTTPDVEAFMNATVAGYFLEMPEKVLEFWRQAQELRSAKGADDNMHWMKGQSLEATIAAAHAYSMLQRPAESEVLLKRLEEWLDGKMSSNVRVDPEFWFLQSEIAAIRGDTSLALMHLQRAIDEGWRQHWRAMVEPSLAGLRDTQTFQSMMAGLSARMGLMRERLAFDGLFASATGI